MLLRRIARPLLAGIFIYGGINELRAAEAHAQAAKPVLDTVANLAPTDRLPSHLTMVKLDAGIKIGAGALLAWGKVPRLAATALATSLIPTTLAAHRFWEIDDPQDRSDQLIHFLKNLGLLGGLAIAAADTAGRPSLGWRGRHAARMAAAASQRRLAEVTGTADRAGGRLSGLAAEATGKASRLTSEAVGTAAEQGRTLAGKAARLGDEVAGKATSMGSGVAGAIAEAAGEAHGRLKTMTH